MTLAFELEGQAHIMFPNADYVWIHEKNQLSSTHSLHYSFAL